MNEDFYIFIWWLGCLELGKPKKFKKRKPKEKKKEKVNVQQSQVLRRPLGSYLQVYDDDSVIKSIQMTIPPECAKDATIKYLHISQLSGISNWKAKLAQSGGLYTGTSNTLTLSNGIKIMTSLESS